MQQNYFAKKIFTGERWIENAVIIIEDGVVIEILSSDAANSSFHDLIVPAFIDLQIYGANKKLLAVHPTKDALDDLYEYCKEGGATLFQPTVATNTPDVFYRSIDAVRNYRQQGGRGVIGLHLEGPWLNAEKRGAHPKELIHAPSLTEVKELLEYGKGVISMITLAPEVCSQQVIDLIRSYEIVISAGHSNATYEEATTSFSNGISSVTHLYNAMSGLQHRAPGLVGAAFTHDRIKASIIPDGHHVNYAAIKIAVQLMEGRLFVITDAVTETNEGYYHHHLAEDKYTAGGILSGSCLTMHKAFLNLVQFVQVPIEEALKMCSLYPAELMGLGKKYGRIAPGYSAQFLILDINLNLKEVITC